MPTLVSTLVLGVVALAGCGTQPPSDPAPTAPATSAPASPSSAETSASPSAATCPDGAYRISGLTGKGSAAELGSGTGGSLTLTFTDGSFTVGSNGSEPMKLDVGPGTAELRLDGTITGSYATQAGALTMHTTDATGSASIKGFGINRQVAATTIAKQLLPGDVSGTATCTDSGASVDLPTVSLQLTRN